MSYYVLCIVNVYNYKNNCYQCGFERIFFNRKTRSYLNNNKTAIFIRSYTYNINNPIFPVTEKKHFIKT